MGNKTGERESDSNTYSQQWLEQVGRMFIGKKKINSVNKDPTNNCEPSNHGKIHVSQNRSVHQTFVGHIPKELLYLRILSLHKTCCLVMQYEIRFNNP